jgi:hypothetical protein
MRALLFIIGLTIISLYSCKPNPTLGQTIIHVDTLLQPSISKSDAEKFDICVLRFHTDFNNDTIWIISSNTSSKFIIASTNYSIDYATSFVIKKELGYQIELKIMETTFSFALLKNYVFIDVYYDRKAKRLDIYHSNNILILS